MASSTRGLTLRRSRESGAIAVEFALTLPILLVLVLGGLHLGRVLGTRHRLSDATGYAARSAAISGATSGPAVQALLLARMGTAATQCSSITVTPKVVGSPPSRYLEVQSKCKLPPPFGAGFLGGIGPDEVSVTAAMPF